MFVEQLEGRSLLTALATLDSINNPPSGGDFTLTVFEDSLYGFGVGDFRFSDSLDSPPHAIKSVTIKAPPPGLLLAGQPVVDNQVIPVASLIARELRYVAPANLNGAAAARIVFQVQDDGGTANGGIDRDPTPNTITINIPSVNDPPSGADNSITTAEDTPYVFKVADFPFSDPSDSPPNQFVAVWISSLPDTGRVSLFGVPVVPGQAIAVTDVAAGALRYVPDDNVAGEPLTSLLFQVQDNGGLANGGEFLDPIPRTMTIHVTPVNDPPQAVDDGALVLENGILEAGFGGVLANDRDVDVGTGDVLRIVSVMGEPAKVGTTFTLPSGALLLVREDGSYRYDPNGQYESYARFQSTFDSFTYVLSDSAGVTASARAIVTILGENDAPTAHDDRYTVFEDTPRNVPPPGLLVNDLDVEISILTPEVVEFPERGTLALGTSGSFSYTPAPDFHGIDRFTYRVSDGLAVSEVATVTLDVTSVNDAPFVILPRQASIAEGSQLLVEGVFQDVDLSDTWTATVDFGNGSVPLALGNDNSFELRHTFADNGLYPVLVAVRDAGGLIGTADLIVSVQNVAPQNVRLLGAQQGNRGEAVSVVGSFFDPGTQDTHVAVIDWGDGTSTTFSAGQASSGVPFSAFHTYAAAGVYSVSLRVTDDDGRTTLAAPVNITIVSNDPGASLRSGVLEITGSQHSDNIALTVSGSRLVVNATYGSTRRSQTFSLANVQRVVAALDAGDDALKIDARLRAALVVDAGAGNDRVTAGGGASIIVGGDGNDLLYGGANRDVLIGGSGRDQLWGYGGSDLLIAGATAYDANQQALSSILAEWASSRGFKVRAANLRAGTGSLLTGTSITLAAGVTVFDDNEVDSLMGSGDSDWFFATPQRDKLNDKADLLN